MIDIALLVVIGIVAWCVASEGAWGAALLFLNVLFSGLLAMNFFEPLANYLQSSVAPGWANRWDIICLVGLFAGFVFAFRFLAEYLQPTFIAVHPLVYDGGRWLFGGLAGYVVMAFLLTALHTAPLPREFLGFSPERDNLFGITAPDRQWLGFTQYVTEHSLARSGSPRIFDGPRFRVGSFEGVWPSFPIRYASRRIAVQTGQSSGSTGSSEIRPRRVTPPSTGGGAGRSGGSGGF